MISRDNRVSATAYGLLSLPVIGALFEKFPILSEITFGVAVVLAMFGFLAAIAGA